MKTEYITLKETTLTNNCPECYSTDGMVLSFKQQKLKTKFLIKTKKHIIDHIECTKCENQIYPGQWTLDIERVYEYHKKTITSIPSSTKFTGLFYSLLIIVLLIVGLGYTYLYHPDILGI
ncbi:hypothetical protein D1816_18230 [Aquimarina sp. AD10]|uniref:Uncharacterized protein n=1 Tax=Aquimarina aggregata TaxID=1642818 RepID=A0A162ZM39_9FLAO|nr:MULTISPECIES: hypothetical protein [Aquimarina]AXT62215.1 hypothetical protein D1816_18230 [Aquimarina sp. AD10]KZS39899.1 hypothetical protein AWE51_09650 [Aquimarina aggregata]RKM90590.1 hypothetical protein D7033_24150 [Aquimarina sp. AD10]